MREREIKRDKETGREGDSMNLSDQQRELEKELRKTEEERNR